MAAVSFRFLVLFWALAELAPGVVAPSASLRVDTDGAALLDVLGAAEAAGEGEDTPGAFDTSSVRHGAPRRSKPLEAKLNHLSRQAAHALTSGGAVPLNLMRHELHDLKEELHATFLLRSREAKQDRVSGGDWDAKVETMEKQIQDLEKMLQALAAQEARSQRRLVTVSHAELQAEIDRLKKAVAQMEGTHHRREVLPLESELPPQEKELNYKIPAAGRVGSEESDGVERGYQKRGRTAEGGNAAEGDGQADQEHQRRGQGAATANDDMAPGDESASREDAAVRGPRDGQHAGPEGSGPGGSGPDGSGPDGSQPDGSGPDGSQAGDGGDGGDSDPAGSNAWRGPARPASTVDGNDRIGGGNEVPENTDGDEAPGSQDLDVDTSMPYGDLEPFGREDTARELTEASIRESDAMVDQLERAEVAEEKRAIFRALTRLRGAAITSFDGVARAQTGNLDEYSRKNRWRRAHPLRHLAEDESDVARWAFPDGSDF